VPGGGRQWSSARCRAAVAAGTPVWAGPVVIRKMFSVFLLLFEKRNTLKNVCVLIVAQKLVK
jgi:hypothetical protein